MATITGLTAARMQAIIDKTIVGSAIVGGHLILTLSDGSTVDAGSAVGPTGPQGATGATGPQGATGAAYGFRGARASIGSGQSLPNNANTPVSFYGGTEDWDTDNFHDMVVNTSRFVVPAGLGGYYMAIVHVQINAGAGANADYNIDVKFKKNNVTYLNSQKDSSPSATANIDLTVMEEMALAAGDYIEALIGVSNAAGDRVLNSAAMSFRKVG